MVAIRGLALLLLLQAIGETCAHATGLPIPGPVIGMGLLLAVLQWPVAREAVRAAAELLLSHLSLLFVPVGVGVITHLDLVSRFGGRLLLVIVVSTWVGMATTALLLNWLLRRESTPATSGDGAHG